MKISHRAFVTAAPLATAAEPMADLLPPLDIDKVPRLSCCCRLSELLPKVRQLHDAARVAQLGSAEQPSVAA
ncbi:MAG: hypothetical protein ACRYG7_15370 [Janthinobacterium lividum]